MPDQRAWRRGPGRNVPVSKIAPSSGSLNTSIPTCAPVRSISRLAASARRSALVPAISVTGRAEPSVSASGVRSSCDSSAVNRCSWRRLAAMRSSSSSSVARAASARRTARRPSKRRSRSCRSTRPRRPSCATPAAAPGRAFQRESSVTPPSTRARGSPPTNAYGRSPRRVERHAYTTVPTRAILRTGSAYSASPRERPASARASRRASRRGRPRREQPSIDRTLPSNTQTGPLARSSAPALAHGRARRRHLQPRELASAWRAPARSLSVETAAEEHVERGHRHRERRPRPRRRRRAAAATNTELGRLIRSR